MSRDELARLIDDYSAHGGTVRAVDEGIVTVDWGRETMLRKLARAMSRRGHAKRKQKKGLTPHPERQRALADASAGAPPIGRKSPLAISDRPQPPRGEGKWVARRGLRAPSRQEGGFAS